MQNSAPPRVMSLICWTASGAPASTASVAPSRSAWSSFAGARSTATIWRAPAATAPRTAARPTPPRPTIATDAPTGDPRGVDDRADAGQHRAAEQSRMFERQRPVDLDAGFLRDDGELGEGGDAEMVVHRLAGEGEPARAGEQRSRAVGARARLAQSRPAGRARQAMAAARHEHHHDVIADGEIDDPFADRRDDARGLMAEHHRRRPRPRAVDHRKVGMAETGRRDSHQHFAAAGAVEIDLDDVERPRNRVRRLRPRRPQHRRFDPHRPAPPDRDRSVIAPIARVA